MRLSTIATGFGLGLAATSAACAIGHGNNVEEMVHGNNVEEKVHGNNVEEKLHDLVAPNACGLTPAYSLKTASGWSYVKVAGKLKAPRGIVFDSRGHLLVVENGKGVSVHQVDTNGCLTSSKQLINNEHLNHGITLSPDSKTLVVSTMTAVYKYSYDAATRTVGDASTLIHSVPAAEHSPRTVVIPPATPHLLLLTVGSSANLQESALDPKNGRAVVKVFDISQPPSGGIDYTTGKLLGYGLRNEEALVVDPNNMVWGVENSADDFNRTVNGVVTDIHEGNPAEELNFLGDPSKPSGNWHGYPTCFTVGDGSLFPDGHPATGSQFTPSPNSTVNDATCQKKSHGPRLALEAHVAPIDGKFDKGAANMYVTLHGSWNREVPSGYRVIQIPFKKLQNGNYDPVAAQDATKGYNDILWDTGKDCSSSKCLRPTGISFDRSFGKLYFASDAGEGEIYMLSKSG